MTGGNAPTEGLSRATNKKLEEELGMIRRHYDFHSSHTPKLRLGYPD